MCFKIVLNYLDYLTQFTIISCLTNRNKLNKSIYAHVRCNFPNSFYIKSVVFNCKLFEIKKKHTVLIHLLSLASFDKFSPSTRTSVSIHILSQLISNNFLPPSVTDGSTGGTPIDHLLHLPQELLSSHRD